MSCSDQTVSSAGVQSGRQRAMPVTRSWAAREVGEAGPAAAGLWALAKLPACQGKRMRSARACQLAGLSPQGEAVSADYQ